MSDGYKEDREWRERCDRQAEMSAYRDDRDAAEAPPRMIAKPGSQWAQAAYKAGREDEYIDVMKSRYGGEW